MKIPFSREAAINRITRDGINEIEEIEKINTQEEIRFRLINVMQIIKNLSEIAKEGRKNNEQSTESID